MQRSNAIIFALFFSVFSGFAADEIEVRAVIKYVPDVVDLDTTTKKFDQTGQLTSMGRQLINTGAWETVIINTFTNGWGFFRNDDTNTLAYIELATLANTNIFMKLEANEFALFPLSANGILGRCTTSTNSISGQILKKINIER